MLTRLLATLLLVLSLVPVEASACAWMRAAPRSDVPTRTGPLSHADILVEMLNANLNRETIAAAYALYGARVNSYAIDPGTYSEDQRTVAYVVALAVLRTEGKIARNAHVTASEDPESNIKWAIRAIEALAMVGTVKRVHRAEAWAQEAELHGAALEVLEDINSKRPLTHPAQVRTLERLRKASNT